jgi:actin related protein 2/3 complex subunit 4
MHI